MASILGARCGDLLHGTHDVAGQVLSVDEHRRRPGNQERAGGARRGVRARARDRKDRTRRTTVASGFSRTPRLQPDANKVANRARSMFDPVTIAATRRPRTSSAPPISEAIAA